MRLQRVAAGLALVVLSLTTQVLRAESADEILRATGVKGGIVVHLGCGDGSLAAALRANERYVVHGLDTDAETVAKARTALQAQGCYGPVSVAQYDGEHLPYAGNMVNLIVVSDAA